MSTQSQPVYKQVYLTTNQRALLHGRQSASTCPADGRGEMAGEIGRSGHAMHWRYGVLSLGALQSGQLPYLRAFELARELVVLARAEALNTLGEHRQGVNAVEAWMREHDR